MSRRIRLVSVATVALLGAACSSARTIESGTASPPQVTDQADTVAPAITVAATTPTPVTTPATTVAATTTLPVAPAGWIPIEPELITGQAAFPCCASNYYGTPSPALSGSGTSLADGNYAVSAIWSADPAQPMQLVIRRFEQCTVLPEGACEQGEYSPDELGIDDSSSVAMTLSLDEHLRVILFGFRGFSDDVGALSAAAVGNGADLARLASAVDASYAALIAAPFQAGGEPNDIVSSLAATPAGGFGTGLDGSEFSLSFTFEDAPPLLFQAAVRFDANDQRVAGRGIDVLGIPSLDAAGGQLTLYVYAGFYS